MEKLMVFRNKSTGPVYGRNLGTAILNFERKTIVFNKETIEQIKGTSIRDRSILDVEIYLRPMLDCNGLSIIDKDTAQKFFGALDKIEKKAELPDNKLNKFFKSGCWSRFENNEIKIDSAIDFFDITDDESYDPVIREYEITVGYFVRPDDDHYREYYLIYLSEAMKNKFEKNIKIVNDIDKMNSLTE